MDVLMFEKDQRAWQVTFSLSKTVTNYRQFAFEPVGLYAQKDYVETNTFSLTSTVDITRNIGLQGGFAWSTGSSRSDMTNLWTGSFESMINKTSKFDGGIISIKYTFWDSSELRTYLLVPVIGNRSSIGATWARDPLMIIPKLTIIDDSLDVDIALSFVVNNSFAITGNALWQKSDLYSAIGFGGGLVYRNSEYNGIKISGSIKKGETIQFSLRIGATYGNQS